MTALKWTFWDAIFWVSISFNIAVHEGLPLMIYKIKKKGNNFKLFVSQLIKN